MAVKLMLSYLINTCKNKYVDVQTLYTYTHPHARAQTRVHIDTYARTNMHAHRYTYARAWKPARTPTRTYILYESICWRQVVGELPRWRQWRGRHVARPSFSPAARRPRVSLRVDSDTSNFTFLSVQRHWPLCRCLRQVSVAQMNVVCSNVSLIIISSFLINICVSNTCQCDN